MNHVANYPSALKVLFSEVINFSQIISLEAFGIRLACAGSHAATEEVALVRKFRVLLLKDYSNNEWVEFGALLDFDPSF